MCWHRCRDDVVGTQEGEIQPAAVLRNKSYLCRQHDAKFQPRGISSDNLCVKIIIVGTKEHCAK